MCLFVFKVEQGSVIRGAGRLVGRCYLSEEFRAEMWRENAKTERERCMEGDIWNGSQLLFSPRDRGGGEGGGNLSSVNGRGFGGKTFV